MKLTVRGIYSTALVKLLQDEGFTIVNPTRSQAERFGINLRAEADAEVLDSPADRNCVEIRGLKDVVESALSSLQRSFSDLIILRNELSEDLMKARIGFPNEAKLKLDDLRATVAYTVPYHHYCRAGGEGLSSMVSIAEDLVERGIAPAEEMSKSFSEQVQKISPRIGSMVRIIHIKPSGKRIILGPGRTVWRDNGKARIVRRIMSFGVYDGLGVEKCPGDYAITEASRFQPWMKTSYYSISRELKGHYYNVSTPISLYPDHIHYFDLEVDVVVKPNSKPEIIDADGLEKAVQENRISEGLMKKALKIAEEIASKQP